MAVHGKEKKLPKNYRIDKFLWNIWYFMENKELYGVVGNLEKQGFLGKTTRFGKKTTKGHFRDLGTVFSMMTASDKEVTRQNLKECWKIKACRTW